MARLVSVVMTRTQAEQLLWYIERGTEEGTYYGNTRLSCSASDVAVKS